MRKKSKVFDECKLYANDVQYCNATRQPVSAKDRQNLKKQAKLERIVNKIRRRQRRMGFQSDSHAAMGTAKYWKNVDVLPSDFRNVTSVYVLSRYP